MNRQSNFKRLGKILAVAMLAGSSLFTLGAGCEEMSGAEAFLDKTVGIASSTSLIGPPLGKNAGRTNQGSTLIGPVRR